MTEVNENETTKPNQKTKWTGFVPPGTCLIVGIDTKDGPEHPLWDPRIGLAIDEMLVRNIMTYGILKPLLAEKVDDKLFVIDGRRRELHAREANRRRVAAGEEPLRVPVMLKKGDAQRLIGTKEAANRFNVSDGPLTSAKNCQRMVDLGMSHEDIANSFGVSDQTIRNWLDLLSLDEDVRKAMEADELSTTSAMMFAPLTKAQQKELLAEVKTKPGAKKTTVAEVKKRATAKQGKESKGTTPKERVEKAILVLTKTAVTSDQTKELYLEALNKLSRVLAGKSFDKLGDD